MAGVKIPVEASFDPGDLQRLVQQFTDQVNKLGSAVASANKIKYEPVDKRTLENMRQLQAQFESLKRISGGFNQRLRATGQGSAGFFDIDWARMYDNPTIRARQMRQAYQYVAAGVGGRLVGAPIVQPGAGGGRGGSGGGSPPNGPGPGPGSQPGWRSAGRNIVSSGLRATGPVGSVADSALSAGLTGGAVAGLAGLIGGLVALGVGKAISGVMNKVSDAQRELVQYDTLKRTLGDVDVSFNVLKESLRAASKSIDVTFEEGQKLGTEFAKISNLTPSAYRTLAEEVQVSGGFGRSFGLNPGQSNAFFAQMRQFQVTGNERDSRRLAVLIGEAVGKSDSFSKADEMLQAIASFTAQQTRMGLVSANVGGYAGMMSGLLGARIPGMDPAGAANVLGRVNSAITGGGGAGEAGQNFIYMALGRRLGLDPIQTMLLQEQGAFGTGAATFGKNSLFQRFADKYHIATPGTAAGSTSTNFEMLEQHFQKMYAGRPELMLDAMSRFYGINHNQAMALSLTSPATLGKIAGNLGEGFDWKTLSPTGIATLSRINSGGRDVLQAEAKRLFGMTGTDALSTDEQKRLSSALASGNDEDLRKTLTKLAATREQEKTDGSETRKATVGILNLQQEMASKLVPLFNDMRDGILFLAGENGKHSPMDIRKSILEADLKDKKNSISAQYQNRIAEAGKDFLDAKKRHDDAWEDFRQHGASMTPEQQAAARANLAKLQAEQQAAQQKQADLRAEQAKALGEEDKKYQEQVRKLYAPTTPATSSGAIGDPNGTSKYDDLFLKYGKQFGVDPKLLKAIAFKESRFDPDAVGAVNPNGTQDFGLMQHNSAYLGERNITDWHDPDQQVREAARLLANNMKTSHGNIRSAVRMYNGSGDKAETYADDVMRIWGKVDPLHGTDMYSTALPDGSKPGSSQGQNQRFTIDGTFTLNKPDGTPAAAPVQINKTVGAASAFGSQ